MRPKELRRFMKKLGVYHDMWCKGTTEAVITEKHEELSLKARKIITTGGEELSLGGGPQN